MALISITDNHDWADIKCCSQNYCVEDIANLKKIANIPIADLNKSQNLLIFPSSLNKNGDDIGSNYVLSLRNSIDIPQISTGNTMGFIGINDTQINIRSRFTQEDSKDYFLHYMLMKVFSINLFDLKHSDANDAVFDFLLYLFPFYLKKAIRQGLFKKYKKNEYNDARVRGVINVNRHIRQNIPFATSIAYDAREHSFDNAITQLIRHTIEYISGKSIGRSVLLNDMETRNAVTIIREATPSYSANERTKVLNMNLRSSSHPFYSEYAILQKICVQILRHKKIKFGVSKDRVYGILFDGAWLWEEYLYTILKANGFVHPKNKSKDGGLRMFTNPDGEALISRNSRRLYPDFYKKDFILDAKYKHLERGVGREDLYQVVSYMYCTQATKGGYIYPTDNGSINIIQYQLAGYGGVLNVIPFEVPQNADKWTVFIEKIKLSQEKLISNIK